MADSQTELQRHMTTNNQSDQKLGGGTEGRMEGRTDKQTNKMAAMRDLSLSQSFRACIIRTCLYLRCFVFGKVFVIGLKTVFQIAKLRSALKAKRSRGCTISIIDAPNSTEIITYDVLF